MYTIKEAAARTGVSVPLLRAWERRYGIVEPARTAARYRLYDDAALARIQAMRRMVESGWSPSAAAAAIRDGRLPSISEGVADPAPDALVDGLADAGNGSGRGGGFVEGAVLARQLVDAAIAMDAEVLEGVLDRLFAMGTFEHVVDAFLVPALDAVGDAWSDGRLSVAGEHAASHAVHRRLSGAFQAAGRPARGHGAVLVGMPPAGRHELGALAFAVAAKRAGLPVLYLGSDLPVEDWVATDSRVRPRAAVIGSVMAVDARAAAGVARALREANAELAVAFGGASAELAAAELAELEGAGRPPVGPDSAAAAPKVIVLRDGIGPSVDVLRSALGGRG